MKKIILFLMVIWACFLNAQDFKVLYVYDDNYGNYESGPIKVALENWGGSYDTVNIDVDGVPGYDLMEKYDFILWYTGNDYAGLHVWQAENGVNSRFLPSIIDFGKHSGVFWLDGISFLYDVVGTAPDDFPTGSFIHDTLGIVKYVDQGHSSDAGTSSEITQLEKAWGNNITSKDTLKWLWSSLYYEDSWNIADDADTLYIAGDNTYDYYGKVSAFYHIVGNGVYFITAFRSAKFDAQSTTNTIIAEVLNYAASHWDNESISIAPTDDQTIVVNHDGTPITADVTVGWDSLVWMYSTTSGGPYQRFSPSITGKTYTPNFSSPGTYYVVLKAYYGSQTLTSEEVKITVLDYSVEISPDDIQFILTGNNGTTLTANENPTADSREWKFRREGETAYQSFSPAQTGTTFTPNFAEKGIYYVVCQSVWGSTTVTSNEVKIVVDTAAFDYYLAFDGDDSFYVKDDNQDYINVSDKWTFETWVKVNDYQSGTYPVIMDRAECFSMYVQADNEDDFSIAFVKRDASDNIVASLSSYATAPEFKFGKWYHIAVTYDGIKARMFVNGQAVDSTTDDFVLRAASTDFINIGARYRSGYERYLNGALENIRMSKKVRYTSNFTPDFYAPLQADTNDVFCLNLESPEKNTLFDFSGHFTGVGLRNSPNDPAWEIKYQNGIYPTDVQNIVQNQDGNTLTVSENGLATSREWKYSITSGSGYQSFVPAQTGDSYTPNFADPGTYYVVCETNFDGHVVTSNEVQINVSEAASISTGNIDGSPFYISNLDSAQVYVPFTITGTFNSDNVFTAYLSDANGDFSGEIPIGSLAGTSSDTILAYIPAGTPSGTAYRIRVKGSSPVVEGSDNGADLEIVLLQNSISPTDTQIIEINQDGNTLTVAENQPADSREWKFRREGETVYHSFSPVETGTSYTPNFPEKGVYHIVCESYYSAQNITARSNEVTVIVETPFKILLVNDDNNDADETAGIDTALKHSGYTYYKINTADSIPSFAFLKRFDLVLWFTGNDGLGLGLWDTTDMSFVAPIRQYVSNGGVFWLDGLDWLYDIYGGAPVEFSEGQFVYDELEISQYLSQSQADDGNTGVPYYQKTNENSIFNYNTIQWQYSTLWFADGLALRENTVPLYVFGGDDSYPLKGQVCSYYTQKDTGTYLITQFRLSRVGNGSTYVQDSVDRLVKNVIDYSQQIPALHCGNVDKTEIYLLPDETATIKVPYTINGGFDFDENNVFTAYLSDEYGNFDNETAIGSFSFFASDTIIATIPADVADGIHYRIRIKSSNPTLVSDDNGTDITILHVSVSVSPADTQTIYIYQPGDTLTAMISPTPDTVVWKYALNPGGNYISFDPPQTGLTYVPYFQEAGTYYVVCVAYYGASEVYSNEVIINVLDAEINTGTIEGSPFTVSETQGVDIYVPFSAEGYFTDDNVFTAYLSDSTGNFDNAVAIGNSSGKISDTISATIPANTPSGSHYRIRVQSSNPEIIGQDNGEDLIIILTTTGIGELGNILVYPNPVGDVLTVKSEGVDIQRVLMFNGSGKVVKLTERAGKIDVTDLESGVYILRIITTSGVFSVEIVKK